MVTFLSISRFIQLAPCFALLFVTLAKSQDLNGVSHMRGLKIKDYCALFYTGTDWHGGDINSFTTGLGTASACCTHCDERYGERAVAYIYRRDFDRCYCKDTVNRPSTCSNCQGRNSFERFAPSSCHPEYNYDNYGRDLPGMPIEGIRQPGACCTRCRNYRGGQRCVAWVWRRDSYTCFLKYAVVRLTQCPQCVHGRP